MLRLIRPEAARFGTDMPELQPSVPPVVRAAADGLRTPAVKTSPEDMQYATTGRMAATDPAV